MLHKKYNDFSETTVIRVDKWCNPWQQTMKAYNEIDIIKKHTKECENQYVRITRKTSQTA